MTNKFKKRTYLGTETEYIAKERGNRFHIRYSVRKSSKIEIKEGNKIHMKLWIPKKGTKIDVYFGLLCCDQLVDFVQEKLGVEMDDGRAVFYEFRTEEELLKCVEEIVNYAKTL